MTTVLSLGTFDLLHSGHLRFFEQARRHGDRLTVAVNTDRFASTFKRRPVQTLRERMAMLAACRLVDDVVVNTGGADAKPTILDSGARVVVYALGPGWDEARYLRQLGVTPEWLKANQVRIVYVPYTQGVSTTDLIARAKEAA